jgi:hypothetical protein
MTFTEQHKSNAHKLALAIADGMKSNDEAIYYYGEDEGIEAIESEPRDGFIPYTSGGFEVCLPASLNSAHSSGRIPAPLQGIIDSWLKDAADEWAREYPGKPSLIDCICGEDEDLSELACEFESEYLCNSDECYFWKARVMFLDADDRQNESGKPEVYIDAYLNTDIGYGRDHIPWMPHYGGKANQTVGSFKLTIAADDFAAMGDDALETLAIEAVKQLP